MTMISATFPYPKHHRSISGKQMAYVEVGTGDPIVFLHGNPTSSYLWRNILPYLENLGRCLAPDLIGMGDSEKLASSGPTSYTFVEHRRYLDALLDELGVQTRTTLVLHDWGGVLGLDWANRHRQALKGIVYMETTVRPRLWSELDGQARTLFQALRSPAGEQLILENNLFVEQMLPRMTLRQLTPEEMNHYRRPFAEVGEGRRPTLTFPRQIPIEGDPPEVTKAVNTYGQWLTHSTIPKLLIRGNPGASLTGAALEFCQSWPAQTETIVSGLHFLQEDSPDEIGQAIAHWLKGLN